MAARGHLYRLPLYQPLRDQDETPPFFSFTLLTESYDCLSAE